MKGMRVKFIAILGVTLLLVILGIFIINQNKPYESSGDLIEMTEAQKEEMKRLSKFFTEDEIKTLRGVEKINNHPLYVMKYHGDYGFDDFIDSKKKSVKSTSNSQNWACSCIAVMGNTNDPLFGRNFDWNNCPTLVLFTEPENGYASVSVVDIEYLGFSTDTYVTDTPIENRVGLLNAPFYPFDGMNEKGVTIGVMTVLGSEESRDSNKPTLGSLEVVRLILDNAENTDEAIELIRGYNISFAAGPPLHYLIADRSGKSAVVEFYQGEMKVTYNNKPYQVATNFMIYGSNDMDKSNCDRYSLATKELEQVNGTLFQKGVLDLMKDISVPRTQWTSVYNMATGDVSITVGRDYDDVKSLKLEMSK